MNESSAMVEAAPVLLDSIHPENHVNQEFANPHSEHDGQASEQRNEENPSNVCDPVARSEIRGVRQQMDVVVNLLHKILEKLD